MEFATLLPADIMKAYSGRNVLVAGGLGLIGSTIVNKLVPCGARVTVVDALLPLYGGNLFNLHEVEREVQIECADIRDEEAMNRLVKGQDVIFNLAAQVSYLDSLDMPMVDLDINCRGHLIVLEACRKLNPQAKLLFPGSRMQFGRIVSNPVDETHPLRPLSPYAIHKTTGEMYYQAYYQMYGLRTVVLRLSNPYGPRQQMKHSRYGLVNWFIRMAMEDQTLRVFGDGRQIRDYIHVEDVADVLIRAGVSPQTDGQVYNVGSGVGTRFIDMVRTVIRIVGKGRLELVEWPHNYRNIETGDYVTNIAKVSAALGWSPQASLDEGIEQTFRYYSDHRNQYWGGAG